MLQSSLVREGFQIGRKVIAWCISISFETTSSLEVAEEPLVRYGKPEIFNTDQPEWTIAPQQRQSMVLMVPCSVYK